MPGSTRMTTKEKQAEAERKLQLGLSLSENSAQIGIDIINSLEQQKEKQLTSIDNVESTEYLLHQSMRTLRGMTWKGYFYNLVSNDGKLRPASTTAKMRAEQHSTAPHSHLSANENNESCPESNLISPKSSDLQIRKQNQDNEIEKLSSSLTKLQDVSVSIGQTLIEHDEIADSLTEKTNDANDYALSVTLRTAQMSQRSTGSKATLVGEYKFKTMHNNFLSVFDDSITLTPQFNWSTVFRVYVKENHLFALQNAKTRKFIGLNFWGSVVATSSGFGKNQEVHIDMTSKTGILFLASNWGNGGWLKPDKDGLLRCVTSSMLDRDDRLLLTPIELTEADYKKLKNF